MTNIYLAALGWIADDPQGNRLRWSYPYSALDANGNYLGFPSILQVWRAPVDNFDHLWDKHASVAYPFPWWQSLADHVLTSVTPVDVYHLPAPAQAVTFRYINGSFLRVLARDKDSGRVFADRTLMPGETFFIEAPGVDELVFTGLAGQVTDFRFLDLFQDQGLDWEMIAEIRVAEGVQASFADVALRNDSPPQFIGPAEWADLSAAAAQAQASNPASAGKPSPWQAYQLMLRVRWEAALLSGSAYFDGPRHNASPLDTIHHILDGPPGTGMAYRIIDADGRVGPSNIAYCPDGIATPLNPPGTPTYQNSEVRLEKDDRFNATLSFHWSQGDPRAIGVEVEEEIGPSQAAGTPTQVNRFETRPPRNTENHLDNSLARSFQVPFHDVLLRAHARAVDAWDRASVFSAWSPPTPLTLRHTAEPPVLQSAGFKAGQVHLDLEPGWQPDLVVRRASGSVAVLRRIHPPRAEKVQASTPVPLGGGLYRTDLQGIANEHHFIGGRIISGYFKAAIASISGSQLTFRVPEGGGAPLLFTAGEVLLQEDHKSLRLWTQVAAFPAVGLGHELEFSDSPPGKGNIQYCLRVRYLNRWGRASNIATALRFEPVPAVPPPFLIQVVGRDYYERALVRIVFTSTVSQGQYSVWWADGWVSAPDFTRHAVPGEYNAQPVVKNQLFDLLSLPRNQNTVRPVTIGVQQVNQTGGQSEFQIVQHTLQVNE